MAAANQQSSTSSGTGSQPGSPPQYQMEQMSLAEAMNANKQALNRRLMLRRSVNELVDAGIYPSSPLAFAGQRTLLERAKTSDILKHKIEQRPGRDFLVQHHILEDSNVDPSLQSAQRRLKKAKLTDELNEKLAHRPGPLELVEQSILEADDPIKTAIKEGKLEFQKTEEGVELVAIPKLPYEIVSPKSGESSPEPSDYDNDSSASSSTSTGFLPISQVPSPPDIAPLLNKTPGHTSITIGGKTLKIPITQSFNPTHLTVTVAPHQFTTIPHTHRLQPSGFGASRNNRRSAKLTRPKQQMKQRVIKFHEYKGPSASKSSNSNSGSNSGSFVTSTGPIQKLDELTPYQVSVQQQQLYLQCQLEASTSNEEAPGGSTVLVPIRTQPAISMMHQPPTPGLQQAVLQQQQAERPEIVSPRLPDQQARSRPTTPSLSLKSPPLSQVTNPHNPLHITRSLSHLEDLKVAELKHELKQRNLLVSGSKPQLIERLRNYQLQELSASVPSVSSTTSDFSYSTSVPSVRSFSDEVLMAPPSVASTCGASVSAHMNTPPPTPCSPQDEFMRSPSSVMSKHHCMEADDSSQAAKSTAEIVREQAKQIEELQRTLFQFQQQLQMTQQPFVVPQTNSSQGMESTSEQHVQQQQQVQQLTPQQVQELIQQQLGLQQQQQQQNAIQREQTMPIQLQTQQFQQTAQPQTSPVDITDKKVYLTTPDGKMTAYKVILHTGNGLTQRMVSRPDLITSQTQGSVISQISNDELISGDPSAGRDLDQDQGEVSEQMGMLTSDGGQRGSRGIDVDDVLEVLIRTGEIDPQMMNNEQSSSNGLTISDSNISESPTPAFSNNYLSVDSQAHLTNDSSAELNLHPPLSPLADMDWMDDSSNHYLEGVVDDADRPSLDGNDNDFTYDWLSDVMHLDAAQTSKSMHLCTNGSSDGTHPTSDPLLTPKPDGMSIFEIDEPDFRTNHDSSINWDKLIWQT